MWWLFALAFAADVTPEANDSGIPTQHYQQVVFPTIPTDKQRLKLIRKAFKVSDTVNGGKDWGRVMCFVFNGDPEPGALDAALQKSKLIGLVRPSADCATPPGEAYIPPEPIAVRKITFDKQVEPITARSALAFVLEGDHGISGIHVPAERSNIACLELERDVGNGDIKTLLEASEIPVVAVDNTATCVAAFGTP
jgi:hypothetical protein